MPPINRYSRGYTPQPYQSTYVDQFIPLPVGVIGRSGEMLQEREDRAIEQLDAVEATMANVASQVSSIDRPQFAQIGDQYRQRIEALPEDGVYFNKMRQIKSLAREFDTLATPFIQNQQAIKAATDAILENKTLSSTDKQRRLKALTGDYQGLALTPEGKEVDPSTMFRGRSFADRVDIASIADKAISGIKERQAGFKGAQMDEEGNIINIRGGESVSADRVQAIAASAIYNSPEAMAFIEDEVELALRENPDADPAEIRNSLVGSAIDQAVNKWSYTNPGYISGINRAPSSTSGDDDGDNRYSMVRSGVSTDTSVKSVGDYDKQIAKAREEGNEPLAENLEADRRFAKEEFIDSPEFGGIAASMFGKSKAGDLTSEEKDKAFNEWNRFREFREATREKVESESLSSTYAPTRAQMNRRPQNNEEKKRKTVQKQLQDEFGDDYQKLVKFDTEFNNFLSSGRTSTDYTISPSSVSAIREFQNTFVESARRDEFEVIGEGEDAEHLRENFAQYFDELTPKDMRIGSPMSPGEFLHVAYEDKEGNRREARLKYVAPPAENDLPDTMLRKIGTPEAEAIRKERSVFGRTLFSDKYKPVRKGSDISIALTRDRGVKAKVGSQELTGDMMWNRVKNRASDDQIVNLSRDLAMSADRHNILLTEIDIQKGLKGQLVGDKRKAYEELMNKPVVFDRRVDAFESAVYFRNEQ